MSMFSGSEKLIANDPFEEIFALNLGDFLSEHLISRELAKKIENKVIDKDKNLRNQLNELVSIYSINNTLSILGFNNKQDYVIYNAIAKTLVQMIDADACQIFLLKGRIKDSVNTDKDLVLAGSSLNLDKDIHSYNIGYKTTDEDYIVQAFKNKQIMNVNVEKRPEYFNPVSELQEDKTKIYTAVPMHNNSEAVGVIVIESHQQKDMDADYLELMASTARLFAGSIILQSLIEETLGVLDEKNAPFSELKHLRAELTLSIGDLGDEQQKFVENLAKAVDVKGQYRNNHSGNVALLAKEICQFLDLNEKTKDLIYYAALLQNIGKIVLPKELLNKKDKLSKEEWDELQKHANIGVNLLMGINFLSEVIPYITYHKERWDGKGEPEGLKGYSIPFGSRIIAVADAYCAMTIDRPYREAIDNNMALEIIKKEATLKWDPIVVDALINIKTR